MKVKELIEILLTFDPNLDIVIQGYEGGVTENISIELAQVVCNVNSKWYYGEHEVDSDYHQEINPNNSRKKVLCISR